MCPKPGEPERHETVDGWRLHVELGVGGRREATKLLEGGGFTESGYVHSTHSDCGYDTSFRADVAEGLKIQVCLARDGVGADIDLDTPTHRSAPWHIYESLRRAYSDLEGLYVVDDG